MDPGWSKQSPGQLWNIGDILSTESLNISQFKISVQTSIKNEYHKIFRPSTCSDGELD